MGKQTDYMKGLTAAEERFNSDFNDPIIKNWPNVNDDKIYHYALKHLKMELQIDTDYGDKSQSYLDGYSDYISQIEYRRNK